MNSYTDTKILLKLRRKKTYFLQLLSDNKREIENRPIIGKSTKKFEMTLLKFGKGAKSTVFLK